MEKQEEWRPVVGYENFYEVSNLGRVKSLPRKWAKGGILKPVPKKKGGYLEVGLCKNGKKEPCKVHQLVMEAFVGRCPDGYEVDHIDWNPNNNRLSNLRYLPAKENAGRKSPEWYKNTAEANKKRAADPEWLQNVAEANRRKAQDPEWLEKTAEAVRKTRCKPVNQYTLGGIFVKTWESATDAARELGLKQQSISACCKGKRKTAGGFFFQLAQ